MKRVSTTLCVLVVILAFGGTASAQSTSLRANIPFDFAVGDKHLDKGEYIVHVDSGVVQLRNLKGSGAMSLSQAAPPERSQPKSALVFRRYGDAFFLWKVLRADGVARELPQTRGEIEIARTYKRPAIETATAK